MYKMWKVAKTPPTVWDIYDMQQSPGWDYVPFVAGHRNSRRRHAIHHLLSDKSNDTYNSDQWNSFLGQGVSALPVGVAAYFPGKKFVNKVSFGKLKGGKTALALSTLAMIGTWFGGRQLAGMSPTPSMQSQYDAINSKRNTLKNYLIPGRAAYQRAMFQRYVDSIKDKHPRELIERSQALIRNKKK